MKVVTRATPALLLVLPVLLLGCPSDTVEFDEGEMVTFEGTILDLTAIDTYEFVVVSEGTVRIELTRLDTSLAETGEPVEPGGIGVAFGRPNTEGACSPTLSDVIEQTEAISVFVPEGVYCLAVFAPAGVYPDGTVLDYTLALLSGA